MSGTINPRAVVFVRGGDVIVGAALHAPAPPVSRRCHFVDPKRSAGNSGLAMCPGATSIAASVLATSICGPGRVAPRA